MGFTLHNYCSVFIGLFDSSFHCRLYLKGKGWYYIHYAPFWGEGGELCVNQEITIVRQRFFFFWVPPKHAPFLFFHFERLQVRTWQAPHPWLLPSSCGCVYLGAGNQQLGRSLPLSGCLTCPGLEAIVISYCSRRGKGRERLLHTALRHHCFYPSVRAPFGS